MLIPEDRNILQTTSELALAFIFNHCDDSHICSVTTLLVNEMWEIFNQEKQCQDERGMGMGGSVGSNVPAQQASDTPRQSRLNETMARISGIGGSRA